MPIREVVNDKTGETAFFDTESRRFVERDSSATPPTGRRILSGIGQGELDWLRAPLAMAQQAGHELTSIPRYVRHPTQFLTEAGRGAQAIVGATPEIAGGVTGGILAGPAGVVAGPAA